jgi:hypothetical protein
VAQEEVMAVVMAEAEAAAVLAVTELAELAAHPVLVVQEERLLPLQVSEAQAAQQLHSVELAALEELVAV